MGPQDRQHSARPAAVGLIALALGAAVMAVAVPALRKPEREGWIALPPQPMDATDPDIRQLLSKSERIADPDWRTPGPRGLAAHCGSEDVEPATPPPSSGTFLPSETWRTETHPDPVPIGGDRYVMWLGSPDLPTTAWHVQIDVHGSNARVRVHDDLRHRPTRHPLTLSYREGFPVDRRIDLSRLKALREAWNVPELWTAPQRSAVFCAQEYGGPDAFFEACVDGRYFARDRACDRNAQEPLRLLWQRVTELTPAPPSKR
ncbi:hypothetical protein [Pseudomonas sp. CGJS7]|uniref:hypothetical protein n=1 Tax=Pseudomonas sp. CGJS7 TaxID=3109348 RepID=UPI0030089608